MLFIRLPRKVTKVFLLLVVTASVLPLSTSFPLSSSSSSSSLSSTQTIQNMSAESSSSSTTTTTTDLFESSSALSFISDICGKLKTIKRTGWVRKGIPLPESDSDHMHRCAICAMLVTTQQPDPRDNYYEDDGITLNKYHPSKINSTKLLRMALTHDLCESLAGDITPFCNNKLIESKYDKEKLAMEQISKIVGTPLGEELYNLWKEYEEQKTTEALICKDIDKFEMIVQAYEYERDHLQVKPDNVKPDQNTPEGNTTTDGCKPTVHNEPLRTFFITTQNKMKSPLFQRLDKELRQRREQLLNSRGWIITDKEK